MNCKQVQNRLLGQERLDQPSAELQAHITDCPGCWEWQHRMMQLERHVPSLVVPHTNARLELLRQVLLPVGQGTREDLAKAPTALDSNILAQIVQGDNAPSDPTIAAQPEERTGVAELPTTPLSARPARRDRRWWYVALATAASFLVLASAWWALQPRPNDKRFALPNNPSAPPDPLLAKLVQCDLRLAEVEAPRDRMEILAEMADNLENDTLALILEARSDDLEELAHLYARVVRDGVVHNAVAASKTVPFAQRKPLFDPLADRFGKIQREARRLAREVPVSASGPLHAIAVAAGEGEAKLRALLRE